MGEIPELKSLKSIPKGQTCQEASPMSGNRYIACGAPAVAIVHNGDRRPYAMCEACTMHNVRNRNGRIVYTKDAGLKKMLATGLIKKVS